MNNITMKKYFFMFFALCSLIIISCENPLMRKAFGLNTTSFNSNGGSMVESQELLRGETVTRPRDPVKVNNIFDGWYEDNDTFLNEWDFDTVPNRELTLYAKWLEVETSALPSGLTILAQPNKLTYIHGELLNLTGLVVTVAYSDGSSENIPYGSANFTAKGFTATPAHGTLLSHSTHNGTSITVSGYGFNADTASLTVSQRTLTVTAAAHTKSYDNSTTADDVTVTLNGILQGDNVSVSNVTASYTSPNVGTREITITAVTLTGADAGNYTVTVPVTITMTEGGIKQPGGANITLTVEQIKDITADYDTTAVISRSGNDRVFTVQLADINIFDANSVNWRIEGIGNYVEQAGGDTFIVDLDEARFNILSIGLQRIRLQARINTVLYSINITFRIE